MASQSEILKQLFKTVKGDKHGKMLLHLVALEWCVTKDHLAVVEKLLEAGADVDQADQYGSTPLSTAAMYGHNSIVERLLEAGADKHKAT